MVLSPMHLRAGTPEPDVLVTTDVRKSYGPTVALRGASITLRRGEVHVLLGENGAGKSTLAKIIAGVVRPDGGSIAVGNQTVEIHDARTARGHGIAIVFQEFSLAPHLSVAENLFLGTEKPPHPFALLNRREEASRAREVLDLLELHLPLNQRVASLSSAEKQMLEIAKALLQSPHILILDEPTSTLSEREKSYLFSVIAKLRAEGVSILYVTHHLREVTEIGTRVSAMLDGEVTVTTDVTDDLTEARLLEMLTGRKLSMNIDRSASLAGDPLLVVDGLKAPHGCRGVSFNVRPGEVVGIYGVMGCGREGISRVLAGIVTPTGGSVRLDGRPFAPRHPAEAVFAGVGYLPMDRKARGILPTRPVRENVTLSNLQAFARHGVIDRKRERGAALETLTRVGVRYQSTEQTIVGLSGGNQQKVLFGRALSCRPRLLVMEDPLAGIDMGAKLDLYRTIRELADQGMSFLLFSSDLAETVILCNRIYAMYSGRIVDEIVDPEFADEERILAGVLGREMADAQ